MSSDLKEKKQEVEEVSPMLKNYKKAQILQQKRESDANITSLVDKFIVAEAEYGIEHYKTQMLLTFLELIVPLKELSDLILDMQEALGTLSDTLGLIDDTLNFINDMMTVSPEHRYNLLRRLKERRRISKFIKNHSSRMKSIATITSGLTGISTEMRKQLEKISIKMRKNTLKQKEKAAKDRAKNKDKGLDTDNKTAGYFMNASAEKLITDRKKQHNMYSGSNESSSAPAPVSGSGDISDVDDIVGR